MVSIRIEHKSSFNIIGVKTWIPDTDNQTFADFWQKCHADGAIDDLRKFNKKIENSETKSAILGLSCTEKDPSIRSFYFYIAVETAEETNHGKYEIYQVMPLEWAIFSNEGSDIEALMACEMYAWQEWLPINGIYEHDNGPEMEVYFNENKIEYWLPIRKRKGLNKLMDEEYQIFYADKPEWEIIGGGISDYNTQQAGDDQGKNLCFLIKGPGDEILGGVIGATYWDWLYVNLMWLKEELRGRGYGSKLLMHAEEEARKRGAKNAYLDTFSFQAPEFYKKHGYQVFGVLPDFPAGHQRFFLTKQL